MRPVLLAKFQRVSGTVTLVLFAAMISIRDIRLISLIRTEPSAQDEFEDVSQICSDYPRCLRIVPSILGHMTKVAWGLSLKILSVNPDPFGSQPITFDDRLSFINLIVSLFFRIICGIVIWLFLKRLLGSTVISNLISSLFLLLLIAPHAMVIKSVSTRLDFYHQEITWVWQMLSIYLIYYDYFAVVVVFILLYKFVQMAEFSALVQVILGTLLFFSFEFLPLFYLGLLVFSQEVRIRPKHLLCLMPGIFTLLVISTSSDSENRLTDTFLYYFLSNITNLDATIAIILITLVPPYLIGHLTKLFLVRLGESNSLLPSMLCRNRISAALKSLILIHLMSLVTSGVNSEFGRQSLALQFVAMLYGLTRNRSKDLELKTNTNL